MKHIYYFLFLFLFAGNIQAQESEEIKEINPNQRKNDIVADPIILIAVPMANFSYERLISQNKGLGVNALIGLDRDSRGFSQFSPYFRLYMGKKYASGFFFEGFIPVTTDETDHYTYYEDVDGYYTSTSTIKRNTTVGVGFGVGGKWVLKNNLVIEASGGIARRFGNRDYYFEEVTGKIMGGIGYRF